MWLVDLKAGHHSICHSLGGDCGQGTHDFAPENTARGIAAAPLMSPSKSWALQLQSRPFSERKPEIHVAHINTNIERVLAKECLG